MQQTLIKFAEAHIYLHVLIITLCTAAILIAMIIDLIAGVQKAKQNGKPTTSRGLKMTAKKAIKYFVPFAVLTLLDMVASFILPAPYFSMVWTAYVLLCEFWSIREKSWQKAEIEEQANTFRSVIVNKDDIAKAVIEILTHKSEQEQTTTKEEEK